MSKIPPLRITKPLTMLPPVSIVPHPPKAPPARESLPELTPKHPLQQTTTIPKPTDQAQLFRDKSLHGFAVEAMQKVQEISRKPVGDTPRTQLEVSALKAQLNTLIEEMQKLGGPVVFYGPEPDPAPVAVVAPPAPVVAPAPQTPPSEVPPVKINRNPPSGLLIPARPILIGPGFSVSRPAPDERPWDLGPITPPPPASPTRTVFAQTPNVNQGREGVYSHFGIISDMLTMEPGGYKKEELQAIIDNINKAIMFEKAPGRNIARSGNKEPLIQRIIYYATQYQNDDYFRPYAPITPGQFPALPQEQRLAIGPTPDTDFAKSNKILTKLGIDPRRLHTNAGGYSTVELENKIDGINDAINARRIPGPILVPHDINQRDMMILIRQYILHNLDDPVFANDDDVKTGQGVSRQSLTNVWHPFAEREYFIHYPKMGQGVLSLAKKSKRGTYEKINGFKNRPISKAFREALLEILKSRRLGDLSELPKEERDYLYKLLSLTKPKVDMNDRQREKIKDAKKQINEFNSKSMLKVRGKQYLDRLTLLVGEVMAGNKGNRDIQLEGMKLLNILLKGGVISRDEGEKIEKVLYQKA